MHAPSVSSRLRPTRHTGVTGTDAWVPAYHLAKTVGIYGGTTPGAGLHYAAGYRRPMVPGAPNAPPCPHG
jgi:3-hydroxy-9,10-secoandrosta-1,3,5(10)-triene-9,17-dione monooxygenase